MKPETNTPPFDTAALPETVRRIGRLEVRARQIVEGFLAGLHRSPYFGQSAWSSASTANTPRATTCAMSIGRSGRGKTAYYVKQYEEDTNLRVACCWSTVSSSMAIRRWAA